MKTLISLITLIAIVFAYFFSAALYVKGDILAAYSLVLASIAGITLWIKSHDLLGYSK
jgi:hypothetical protein